MKSNTSQSLEEVCSTLVPADAKIFPECAIVQSHVTSEGQILGLQFNPFIAIKAQFMCPFKKKSSFLDHVSLFQNI